jgi:hypothetical protein
MRRGKEARLANGKAVTSLPRRRLVGLGSALQTRVGTELSQKGGFSKTNPNKKYASVSQ